MSYSSDLPYFNRQFSVLLSARWWSSSQIQALFQALSCVTFSAHSARDAAIAQINTTYVAPFSLDVRFPAGAFVTDYDVVLQKILSQLVSALAYSDRLLNKTGVATTSNDPVYVASKNSFFQGLNVLNNYIRDPFNYYDTSSFEFLFSLEFS